MNEQIASLTLVEIRDEFREHSVLGPGGDLFQVCNLKGEMALPFLAPRKQWDPDSNPRPAWRGRPRREFNGAENPRTVLFPPNRGPG